MKSRNNNSKSINNNNFLKKTILNSISPKNEDLYISYKKRKKNNTIYSLDFGYLPIIKNKTEKNFNFINNYSNTKYNNNNIPSLNFNNIFYSPQKDIFKNNKILTERNELNNNKKKKIKKKNFLLSIKYLEFLKEFNLSENELKNFENDFLSINKNNENNNNPIDEISQTNSKNLQEFLNLTKLEQNRLTLEFLDNIPNMKLNEIAGNIVKTINNNNNNVKEKNNFFHNNLIIHNIYFTLIVNNIFHKIEVVNEFNQKIEEKYVMNLLENEINKFKKILKSNLKRQILKQKLNEINSNFYITNNNNINLLKTLSSNNSTLYHSSNYDEYSEFNNFNNNKILKSNNENLINDYYYTNNNDTNIDEKEINDLINYYKNNNNNDNISNLNFENDVININKLFNNNIQNENNINEERKNKSTLQNLIMDKIIKNKRLAGKIKNFAIFNLINKNNNINNNIIKNENDIILTNNQDNFNILSDEVSSDSMKLDEKVSIEWTLEQKKFLVIFFLIIFLIII